MRKYTRFSFCLFFIGKFLSGKELQYVCLRMREVSFLTNFVGTEMKENEIFICIVLLLIILSVPAEARSDDGGGEQQAPRLEVVGERVLYPDAAFDLRVLHSGFTDMEVRWLRIAEKERNNSAENAVCVRRDTLFFLNTTANEFKEDTFRLFSPPLGRYIMELLPRGSAFSSAQSLSFTANVSRFSVFALALPHNKAEVIVADAQSGRPVRDVTVFFKEGKGGKVQSAATDACGKARFSYSGNELNGQIKATMRDDRFLSWTKTRASCTLTKNTRASAAFLAVSHDSIQSFSVTLEASDRQIPSSDSLFLTGRAVTADGLPVCGAKVTCRSALVHRFTQIFSRSKASVLNTATTDGEGRFSLLVPLTPLPENGFSDGMIQVVEAEARDSFGNIQYARLNIPRLRPDIAHVASEKQDSTDFSPALVSCINDTIAPNSPARVRISCPADSITLFYMLFCGDELLKEGILNLNDTVFDFVYDTIPPASAALQAEYFFVRHGKLMRRSQRFVKITEVFDTAAVLSLSFSLPDYTIRMQYDSGQPDPDMRTASPQDFSLLPPVDLGAWGISAGNYSSITPIGGNLYAVTDDKAETSGFFVFLIEQDSLTGRVTRIENRGFRGDASLRKNRDAEGVAFTPHDSLIWVSGEADQRILAHKLSGQYAGKELSVPICLSIDSIVPNYGFEALCFDSLNHLFWTMTENSLRADSPVAAPGTDIAANLRLQSFNINGFPQASCVYQLDLPQESARGTDYAFGAVALCPADNGKLWVMERELNVPDKRLNAVTRLKIYEINPFCGKIPLPKRLIIDFSTSMKLLRPQFANYEGLCKGASLTDGRQTWLLISDSQGGYGNKLCHLRDLLRVMLEQ